jgi:hypothetical protein
VVFLVAAPLIYCGGFKNSFTSSPPLENLSANKISRVEFDKLIANGFPVITKYVRVLFYVTAGINAVSSFTKLNAK